MKFIINAAKAGAVTTTLCSGGGLMLLVTVCVTCVFVGVWLVVKNCSGIGCLHSAELILKLKLL